MVELEWALAVAAAGVLVLLAIELFGHRRNSNAAPAIYGRSFPWHLDKGRKTEVVSNRRIGLLQRHRDDGGALETTDQIVVWAREFLDDDILYTDVAANLRKGISYFYILDRMHTNRFRTLLERLYKDMPEPEIVDDGINVIFVRPELTLNNFVLLGYGTPRQCAYSAMIYDERPFAWIRQEASRARTIMHKVKTLVAGVALLQADQARFKAGPFDYFRVDDQLMDFSALGRDLIARNDTAPERSKYNLHDIVASVPIPREADKKVIALAERIRQNHTFD